MPALPKTRTFSRIVGTQLNFCTDTDVTHIIATTLHSLLPFTTTKLNSNCDCTQAF